MLPSTTALLVGFALQAATVQAPTHVGASAPGAEPTSTRAAASTHDGSLHELDVPGRRLADPDVRVDGRLDDPAWAQAPVLHGFTQFEPVEGVDASQDTRVRVLVTDDAILFGIEARDRDADGIRATLTDRDGFGGTDDWVRILLDTFDDQRRAFVFQVNPRGVQGDGLWVEGQGGWGDPIDWSQDLLWESAGRVGAGGWAAELRIPLKSLRFPGRPVQDWGLQVTRSIQRSGYRSSWAPLDGSRANRLEQMGRLSGLRDLDAGLFLEVNPVLTGSRVGAVDGGDFRRRDATGDFGVNATYGLTSNLTLDGTYNPDFSQVEADAGQITVNERFAVYLDEKRPFFLEGADVFSMPRRLVYTRSIVQPLGAAKVSGKVGETQVAYLGAVDQAGPGATDPVVNLLRVKRDVGGSSTVGAVYTDRTVPGESWNRVVGADGRFVLGGRWVVEAMAAASADNPAGAESLGDEEGPEAEADPVVRGSLMTASVDRTDRNLELGASFEDVSERFEARSGFIRRVGTTQARFETGYTFRGGPGALVERWRPSLEARGYWNRDDFWAGRGPEESQLELRLSAGLRGNVGGWLTWSRTSFAVDESEYGGLVSGEDGEPLRLSPGLFSGLDQVSLRGRVGTWEKVRFSLGASWEETPIFSRALGVPVEPAEEWGADVNVSLIPTGSFSTSLGLRHQRLLRKRDGSRYSSATIPRLETRYQFTRALFVRFIGEYASQERADQLDPVTGRTLYYCGDGGCEAQTGSDRHDVSVEGLVGYEPSPGTVFFLGYTRQMRDSLGFRFRDVETRSDGLFVKLSWRFRM